MCVCVCVCVCESSYVYSRDFTCISSDVNAAWISSPTKCMLCTFLVPFSWANAQAIQRFRPLSQEGAQICAFVVFPLLVRCNSKSICPEFYTWVSSEHELNRLHGVAYHSQHLYFHWYIFQKWQWPIGEVIRYKNLTCERQAYIIWYVQWQQV